MVVYFLFYFIEIIISVKVSEMSSGFVKSLKKFCCCIENESDDNEHLIGNEQEYDWLHTNTTNR